MRDLRSVTWLTLWMVGLVVALLTGNAALYVLLSGLFVGSRWVARLRKLRDDRASRIEPGE